MGCLNNFVSVDKLLSTGELEACDIIEFNRLTYSHFGFYIGHGICINVTGPGPDGRMSSSSSSTKNFPKGMRQAERLQSIAGNDYRFNKVRINNCVMTAFQLGMERRSTTEAIKKALEGLKRDPDGNLVLEEPVPYNYNLVHNNCEYFATRCRYVGDGFSIQVNNPTVSATLGTAERFTSAFRDDLADVILDEEQNIATTGGATVLYGAYTAAGWTAYGAKTATDAIAGTVSAITRLFK